MIFYAVLLSALALAIHLISNKYKNGLQKIPGPTLAAYSGFWRAHDVWKGDAHKTAIRLHKQHGTLVRVAPNVVSVSDPDEISTIYGLKPGFVKSAFYPIFSIIWKKKAEFNLFSAVDPEYHKQQKRKAASAFGLNSVIEMEPAVDSCTILFMERLRQNVNKSVDLGMWMHFYAFDVIGELCFAEKLGFLDQGKDIDNILSSIEKILDYGAICGQVPAWHKFLLGNPLVPLLFPSLETFNSTLTFTLKAMNKRTKIERNGELSAIDTNGLDMLSKWAAVKSSDKMSTREIVVHLSANVTAGSDTTAIVLNAIVYFLLKNPDKYKKFITELDGAIKAGLVSDPITLKESNTHLPYFDAITKEALRMFPSIGLLLERVVPKGGAIICGTYFAEGTIVGMNAWVLHYDEKVFPDPYQFLPERWIESLPEHLKKMNKSSFAFGAGSRTCLGKSIGIMEIKKLIPQLYRNFNLSFTEPGKDWKIKNSWLVQQSGLMINLEPRCLNS